MRNKAGKFIGKTILFMLPVLVLFEVLFRLGALPVITNSTLFDTKMMQVQKRHLKKIDLLAMGSSVTLYELKSDQMVKNFNMPYYNLASWGLHITDERILIDLFINE